MYVRTYFDDGMDMFWLIENFSPRPTELFAASKGLQLVINGNLSRIVLELMDAKEVISLLKLGGGEHWANEVMMGPSYVEAIMQVFFFFNVSLK